MNWSLIPTISAPMPFQMALDEILFEEQKHRSQAPVLRFYISSEPWITAGYSFRDASDLFKSALVRTHPRVPVCRRKTGGGCVLHGDDLIFALITRMNHDVRRLGSVRTSYSVIHESVRIGMQHYGLSTHFYVPGNVLPRGTDCFSFPVESDLAWKGKKIAGGAQKRSEGVLLHQESIRIPPGIDTTALISAVRHGFEQVFEIAIQNTFFDPGIYFHAERKAENWRALEPLAKSPS